MKKCLVRAAVFLTLFAGIAAGASAQMTLSGGFALSSMEANIKGDGTSTNIKGDVGIGGNIYFDYLLPKIPMSLGFEIGVDTATISDGDDTVEGTAIPLLFRAAYHFDLNPKLDLYVVGKIGVGLGFASTKYDGSSNNAESYFGVGFGVDLGVAWYFTPRFGIFAEAGFDRYQLLRDIGSLTFEVPFTRFLTFGVSTKF